MAWRDGRHQRITAIEPLEPRTRSLRGDAFAQGLGGDVTANRRAGASSGSPARGVGYKQTYETSLRP